ncbi:MAG: nucleotidyltransferase family protein [Cyclonatronaceae bacterium]
MSTYSDIKQRLLSLKPYLAKKYKVKNIGVFGSYAEGTASASSDLDILVDLSEPLGWEFFELKSFLESEFDRPVDLVTRSALKHQLKEKILDQTTFI